ncbi:hypothetical protein ACLOJK_011867 [Asimina triloba]
MDEDVRTRAKKIGLIPNSPNRLPRIFPLSDSLFSPTHFSLSLSPDASLASSIVGAGPNTTLVSGERRRERDTWEYNPRRRGEKEGERYRGIRPSLVGREGERERIRGKEREIWRREVWRKRQRVRGEENGREGVRASGYLPELGRERRPSYDAKSERDETECKFRSLSELERERCPCEMVESERDETEPELGCLPDRERGRNALEKRASRREGKCEGDSQASSG